MATGELLAQLEEIKHILISFETDLYPKQNIDVRNNRTVTEGIINWELHSEISLLRDFLSEPDTFVEKFTSHYRRRNTKYANSVFSPTRPFGGVEASPGNQLYSRMFSILYPDASPRTRLQRVYPNVDTLIEYQVTGIDENQARTAVQYDNLGDSLTPTAIPELTAENDRYFIHHNLVIDLGLLSIFPIQLHCKFYQALSEQYPACCEKLYQRNIFFRQLKDHILIYLEGGQKPQQVISALIDTFIRGGERQTGQGEASIEAKMAFTDFMEYINGLAPALRVPLRASRGKEYAATLDKIITHLYAGNCVEEAARYLQSILDNPSNATVLNSKPNVADEKKQTIERFYKKTRREGLALSTENTDHNSTIPQHWLAYALGAFTIETINDLLHVILDFPSNLYAPFLKYSQIPYPQILLGELTKNIKTGLFSTEQVNAVELALIDSIDRFEITPLIKIATTTNNPAFFFKIFNAISAEQQTKILWSSFIEGKQLCFWSLANPAFFKAILQCYPGEKCLPFLRQEAGFNAKNTLLHEISKYPEAFDAIAEQLEAKDLITLLMSPDIKKQTPIFIAAKGKQWSLMLKMLGILPIEERLSALTKNDLFLHNILVCLRNDVDVLINALQLLEKPHEVFQALTITYYLPRITRQETLLHAMAKSIAKLKPLLELLTPDECFTAMTMQDSDGNTPLHIAAPHIQAITALLQKIPVTKRQQAIEQTNKAGKSVLDISKTDSKITQNILALRPKAETARPMGFAGQPTPPIPLPFFQPNKDGAKRRRTEDEGEAADERPSAPGLDGV